jgi:hypothetical protein
MVLNHAQSSPRNLCMPVTERSDIYSRGHRVSTAKSIQHTSMERSMHTHPIGASPMHCGLTAFGSGDTRRGLGHTDSAQSVAPWPPISHLSRATLIPSVVHHSRRRGAGGRGPWSRHRTALPTLAQAVRPSTPWSLASFAVFASCNAPACGACCSRRRSCSCIYRPV